MHQCTAGPSPQMSQPHLLSALRVSSMVATSQRPELADGRSVQRSRVQGMHNTRDRQQSGHLTDAE